MHRTGVLAHTGVALTRPLDMPAPVGRPAPPEAAQRLLTVTELALELGVTARAIRFYEDKGLISPSRAGANRVYTRRELARMQLILRGKRLGFSLREVKQFLDLYDLDPGHTEQRRQLLARVRHRIEELEKTRAAVSETLAELRDIESQTQAALTGAACSS